MNWKEYENKVFEYFKAKHDHAIFKRNIKLKGHLSGGQREIDILIENELYGHSIQIAIECKNWKNKLDVADIDTFIGKLQDAGISKGVIVSKLGYTPAAYTRARKAIEVQLQVLDFENLPDYYGFYGVPYRGKAGAIISAPNGWVVNNDVSDKLTDMLCLIHPYEFSIEEACKKKLISYFQIYPIVDNKTLKATLHDQDLKVKQKDPKAKFEYWEEASPQGIIIYRRIDYVKDQYVEFTGAVEADDFFAYCVSAVPQEFIPDDLARLRYIMKNLYLIKLDNVDPLNSHQQWAQFFTNFFVSSSREPEI